MGDPRKMAARMSQVRPVDHRDVVGGGTPGIGVTGLDVAGALALGGAGNGETLMVLHKWVMDPSVQNPLFYVVYNDAVGLATKRKWRIPTGQELLRKLTRLAIAEVTDPKRCPACQGRAEAIIGGVLKTCPTCNGAGYKAWEEKDRAILIGVSQSSWSKRWGARYRQICDIVSGYEFRGLAALRDGLIDDE